ncbi:MULTISPECIES: signal peptidase II [unclassified Mycolicibacterium]|uniref:signal peptidase II n=1 Tax=unclassified Mycolicibacterium TaxID=2636767 RepID=UPI0013075EF2|nr:MULTISPECIES: signal peptidase II [unclassified Mycolicibacterium]MUL83467.1 signal peptidase II [Mycolicibacterium sp. CBMA 329]MUL90458.1 signal peptidase II [Mycolicibacterium sp. CBMA 331]MUM00430.1 signal peptidase II [Mycolicibacterium sp. CBMA 334]MUM28725.1 signal peptidase II [Mycolicibacterium sp. CBMA 295]MUM41402.1 signal peptidase II [Mycolicibacterium sp. CBMA 247]
MTADIAGISGANMAQPTRRRLLLVAAGSIFLLDVGTKTLAVGMLEPGRTVPLAGDWLACVLTRNSGAALSMAADRTVMLSVVVLSVAAAVAWIGAYVRSPWWALGLGTILGGATGNLVDRFFRAPGPLRGEVVDFLAIGPTPVFNVADLAVLAGVVWLIALSLSGFPFNGAARNSGPHAGS